jgi:hypothetical protein
MDKFVDELAKIFENQDIENLKRPKNVEPAVSSIINTVTIYIETSWSSS